MASSPGTTTTKTCYTRHAGFHRARLAVSSSRNTQAKGGDAKAFGGAKYQSLDEQKRNEIFAQILPWLRGQVSPAEALHRHRAERRKDPALREFARTRRGWPSSARAARTIFCARKSSRSTSIGIRRRTTSPRCKKLLASGLGKLPQGLRDILREVQARQFAGDARPEPDRRAHSRPRHDRVGQGQIRIARDGGILQLRRRSHARRGGDRRIHRAPAAGGVRHRILAARGSETQAHAGGKGTRAAGHHRHRRRSAASARKPRTGSSRKARTSSASI